MIRDLRRLALLLLCGCSPEPGHEPVPQGLRLLARKPDALIEQPGAIVPRGDYPGTSSWGVHEGPGWAQDAFALEDGTSYRVTNQPVASLLLPATQPCDRELALVLWCPRPAGEEPAPVQVRVNGIALGEAELRPGREPAVLRLGAPAPLWAAGENQLQLEVPLVERDGQRRWDTLALARVSYGPEARVELDPDRGTARFADGTGARYAVAAGELRLRIEGAASGKGLLALRTGALDPRTGEPSLDPGDPPSFAVEDGVLRAELPLARRAGALRVLELSWSAPAGAELTLTRLDAREAESAARPPVVLVSIDTFAARHLSLHGYRRRTSPVLEALQREAVVFERCLANAPWTLPSYLSVMSGLYPRAHHLALAFQEGAKLGSSDVWELADNRWTLAEALRARGYRTGGFVDTYWLSPLFGLDQGFDTYDGRPALAPLSDPHAHLQRIVEELVPAWLASVPEGVPPFLFVHALDAHGPYWPGAPYRGAFEADLPAERRAIAAGSTNETYGTVPEWMGRTLQPEGELPPELPLEDIIARYDETLLKVDDLLGRLFALLRERGLYDECVIVVTGDHGEGFGPRAYGHGVMREDVLHVPLLVKLPHGRHGGLRVQEGVQLVDLYPTLLELAGAELSGAHLHGQSLLAGLAGDGGEPRVLYSEGGHVEQYALTLGRWRLVEERPGSESSEASLLTHPLVPPAWLAANCPELLERPLSDALRDELLARPGFAERVRELRALVAGPYRSLHDLEADPEELRDLSEEQPEVLAQMLARLEQEKARAQRARADANPDSFRRELDPEARERLEELGYGGER